MRNTAPLKSRAVVVPEVVAAEERGPGCAS